VKYLVDDATQQVRYGFQPPLRSSMSGHFVVDVPDELGVVPVTSVLLDLTSAKESAYQAAYPTLPNVLSDEFLSSATTYTPQSDKYIVGSNKRMAIRPLGRIQTTGQLLTGNFTKVFLHFGVFTLSQVSPDAGADYPGPSRTLLNWNGAVFEEPNPNSVTVEMKNSSNNTIASLPLDSVVSFSGSNVSFRLDFFNSDPDKTLYLSDYYLLWG